MEKKESAQVSKTLIEQLGVYYIYFLCVFVERTFNSVRKEDLTNHLDIPFIDVLSDDFKKRCDGISVLSTDTLNPNIVTKQLMTNFALEMAYFAQDTLEGGEKDCRTPDPASMLRGMIYRDVSFISYHFFGVIVNEKSVYIEPVIEFFDAAINKLKTNPSAHSLLEIEQTDTKGSDYNDRYFAFENEEVDDTETEMLSNYHEYIKAKEQLNKKIFDFNNKIGFKYINDSIKPFLNKKMDGFRNDYHHVVRYSDYFLDLFYFELESAHLLKTVNQTLVITDMAGVDGYIFKNCGGDFVSLDEMEALIKYE